MDKASGRKKNNKGLTLLEILISVCLLAIVLMPISTALMTAMRINLKSRSLLTATDVGQSLMEDISEKTYKQCLNTIGSLDGSMLDRASKQIGFSAIDNDWFNNAKWDSSESKYKFEDHVMPFTFPGGVSPVSITATSLGSNKSLINNYRGLNDKFRQVMHSYIYPAGGDPLDPKMLVYSKDPNELLLYMGYFGINSKGKTYDVVISFLPMAITSGDKYYTYEVFMDVYEYKGIYGRLEGEPTASLKTGILAK